MSRAPLLQTQALGKRFGGLVALDNVSLSVDEGTVVGVIGPNGAGKSTLIGLLGGALPATSGAIVLAGRDVTRLAAAERARLGIGRTYQIPRPFLDLTVEENLEVAQSTGPRLARSRLAQRRGEILSRCGLHDVRASPARRLPLLRRKRLELARALSLEPRVLLLDEVGAGLIDTEVTALIGLIRTIAAAGVTILIVEHVLRIVRECCSQIIVLNMGAKLAEGPPAQVLASDQVAAVYLGTAHAAVREPTAAASPASGLIDAGVGAVLPLVALRAAGSASAQVPLLQLDRISAFHGPLPVLREVSLTVHSGETVAVLGANGAGKTSLANVISGALALHSGAIFFAGARIARISPDKIAALGIAHCMEGRRIFADLSVEQNLRIAARRAPPVEVKRRLDAVYALFPVLAERRAASGTALSGGQQQMLAIGRALMARPRLVIFDEISLGLAPIVMDRLYAALSALKRAGLSMLLVEQDVDRALELADRAYVLEHGAVALEGAARRVRDDVRLRHLYVGTAD